MAILYCKLAQIATSANAQNSSYFIFRSEDGIFSPRKKKEKEIHSSVFSLSLSGQSASHKRGCDRKQKEQLRDERLHWGRSRIGRIWERRQRSNLVMSNVESSGDRVFEEVEFCEPSSQQRIR